MIHLLDLLKLSQQGQHMAVAVAVAVAVVVVVVVVAVGLWAGQHSRIGVKVELLNSLPLRDRVPCAH